MAGLASWEDVGKHPVWLAGREMGTAGEVWLDGEEAPGSPSGVQTVAGFVHQSGGASPQASSGAGMQTSRVLSFRPALNEETHEHVHELIHTQRQGLPSLWLPFRRVETWQLRNTARVNWTLAGTITGSAGASGRDLYIAPKIRIRDASGVVVAATDPANWPSSATLTIVSGAPSAGQVQVPTTTDTTALVTTTLAAYAGGSLVCNYFGLVQVQLLSISDVIEEFNTLATEVEFLESPSQKDFEADV